MLYDESTPLISELKYMVKNISENRESDIQIFLDFAKRSHCEDIDNFVQVYMTCRTMGGNLEKVIKSTTEIIVDKINIESEGYTDPVKIADDGFYRNQFRIDINIESEIRTLTAQKKFEGKIISMMPFAILLLLNLFSPDYLEPLYTTLTGRIVMTAALGGLVFAFFLTERLTAIEV